MSSPEFSQYRQLVVSLAEPALRGYGPGQPGESGAELDITIAVPGARLLLEDDPAQHVPLAQALRSLARAGYEAGRQPIALRDPANHRRDVYHPLALHLSLAAFNLRYESLAGQVWSACEDALAEALEPMRAAEAFADAPPPPEQTALVLWQALCLQQGAIAISRDVDAEIAQSIVHQVVNQPGHEGALHPFAEGESLDAWTYRELAGLHALSNMALLLRNRTWAARVREVATYHMNNTQPDNVTTQPWALFAFLWSGSTRSFADQQLHDATTQGGGERPLGLVAGLLLADAAGALASFES